MPALNPEASLKYFVSISRRSGAVLHDLSVQFVKEIETIREDVRRDEGGGGMCHVVTEILQMKYGWQALGVTYLSEDGDIICGGGHVVSILPDGSVLDPTRDQFGEGHSVSLIPAGSPELGRYRPEFYEDFNPEHEDADGQLDGWRDVFDGRLDCDIQDELRAERGASWWLADKTHIDAYNEQQEAYSTSNGHEGSALRR